jgi:thioesterase domain-containing protein
LGGNSLLLVQLITQIERLCGKPISLAILFYSPTIAQLASVLREEKWPASGSSLIPVQTGGSKLPFFWIHGDNTTALLPPYLGPNQPLYGLEHQSQDGKPARYTQVETIAARYLEEIRGVQPQGPYFLGGYSFGGIVAFEAAQQLTKQGEEVALLVLLDSHFQWSDPPSSPNVSFRDEVHRHFRNIALLRYEEKLSYLLTRVTWRINDALNNGKTGIREFLKKAVCKVYFAMGHPLPPYLRAFYKFQVIYSQALRNYTPKPYPGRAIYIRAETRPSECSFHWSKLMAGGLEVHEVPGTHLDIRVQPNLHFWAEKLKTCLSHAQQKSK